jgi:hypothetical protein
LTEAAKYYKFAADHLFAGGHFYDGLCLEQGLDVAINLTEAAKYYKLAADQILQMVNSITAFVLRTPSVFPLITLKRRRGRSGQQETVCRRLMFMQE